MIFMVMILALLMNLSKVLHAQFSWNPPKIFSEDLVTSRETLIVKRKQNIILKVKSTSVAPVQIGDLVQVFIKLQNEKRGK